ncbi:hypothetical protein ACP6ES_30615, partial [Klebsiella quasipneumoniae]
SLKPHGRDSFITPNATPDFTITQQIACAVGAFEHKSSNEKGRHQGRPVVCAQSLNRTWNRRN